MTTSSGTEAGGRTLGLRLLHFALLALAIGAFGLWLAYLWSERGNPDVWQRDWYCFYSAGQQFLESGAQSVYSGQCIRNYYWLYPPYMLYPYALVSAILPAPTYYLLAAAAIVGVTALALKLLAVSLPIRQLRFETLALFVVGSAALFATLVTGQHSAVLLLGAAGALWALRDDRRFTAGLFLGLIGIKPNWAIVFVLWLLVTRRWSTLGGMAVVGVLLILSTAPMGIGTWVEYLAAGPRGVADLLDGPKGDLSYPAHKLITFEAFTRSTIGALSPLAGRLSWFVLEAVAIGTALVVWIRSSDVRDEIAVTVLVVVAANIYVEFYDALVLALPAAVWWTGRGRYPGTIWRVIAVAAVAIWTWQWVWTVGSPGPAWPSLLGGFMALWIGAEGVRAWQHPPSALTGPAQAPNPTLPTG